MRPGGDVGGQRLHKDLDNKNQGASHNHGTPTTFFLASEDMLGRASSEAVGRLNRSTFGVESLQETTNGEEPQDEKDNDDSDGYDGSKRECRRRSTLKPVFHDPECSPESNGIVPQTQTKESSLSFSNLRHASPPSVSESLTSLSQASQLQNLSLPDSPKSSSTRSFRPSDDESMDEATSQAIISSGEDENDHSSEIQDSSPQLIMPSIKMPSRRPFTDRGKEMGRLKIMIAGDSGIGKTSLIKSVVQTCEDIVHVDPLTSNLPSFDQLLSRKTNVRQEKFNANSTDQITEVYASTRAYPPWWSDMEESKVLRRRKSMGDTVLERNLCFVDTPGYSHSTSPIGGIESVMNYITEQMNTMYSMANMGSGELVSMLSGKGGTQVDIVFYLISREIKSVDIDFMRRLSALTNVIPLIAKADSLSHDDIQILKSSIISKLQSADIRTFQFESDESKMSPPFTICSTSSNDSDNMDASLLMSPDYVQPLVSSELAILVQRVFDKENVTWLRYLAAKKLVYSQRGLESIPLRTLFSDSPTTSNPLQTKFSTYPASPIIPSSSSQAVVSYSSSASSYLQARLADHTQREEKLAQVRLAKWAGDLQRCLQNERARYEAISRGERAVWLTQRLGECVDDGSLVPIRGFSINENSGKESTSTPTRLMDASPKYGYINPRDPLGLLRWNEATRRKGWIAFQVVGSFGVLGAIAIWIAKNWNNGSDAYISWTLGRWTGKV